MAELDYQYLSTVVARAKKGDSDSFAELYAATYEKQYLYAYHFLKDPYLAQDALRRLYIIVLQNLDTLTDSYNFIPWLDQINPQVCKNAAASANQKDSQHSMYHPEKTCFDIKSADTLLSSVFAACDMEPNSLPLSTLTDFRIYRKENYVLPKAITAIVFCGLLLIPILFLRPKLTITPSPESNSGIVLYDMKVDAPLRVKSITATIDGTDQDISETSEKVYSLKLHANGVAIITVTLENGQYITDTQEIAGVDTTPPTLIAHEIRDGYVYITLSDDSSGINYNKVTAQDAEGNAVHPVSYDETTNTLVYTYPASTVDIYIPDNMDNVLHALIKIGE